MKVVFIITGLPKGGAQSMLLKILQRLDSRFAPHVISLTTPGDVGAQIASLGVPVEALEMRSFTSAPSAVIRLSRRLHAIRPEVVQTWLYHADLLGGLAARLAHVPAIAWTIRNGNLDADKNKRSTLAVVRLCARLSNWAPAKIVSCSENATRVHVAHGYAADKIVIVPNGFDLDAFHPDPAARAAVRAALGIKPETLLVGWIGRFHPQKNVHGFLHAAATLHRRMPDVHFLVAGEGLDWTNTAISNALKTSPLGQVTQLLGLRNDIPDIMAGIDVLACSSAGEAFPNVLGEAMSCSVPCAVTDVGDSAYIVGDTGRVVPRGDMLGLAAQMEELLRLTPIERLRLGERARERVERYFEIGNVVKQYECLYEQLARDRR